jgi:LysR family transcriptional regulator for bpeEF and oprC
MDRLDAIRLFIRVVERGSFAAAARDANIGQSAASKQIAALEAHLGVQLLQRTTRSLRVTEAGQSFYASAVRLIEDYRALESRAMHGHSKPAGLIRISVAPVFGRLYVVPRLGEFFERFPDVRVEMVVSDRLVNLIEDGIDVAIRHGDLDDSSMKARKLATNSFVTVATPRYLDLYGRPENPGDLAGHRCIGFSGRDGIRPWLFKSKDGVAIHHPEGSFRTNDGEQVRSAVLSDLGLANIPSWIIMPELASGAVQPVLQDCQMDASNISAVYPSRAGLSAKVRVFVDFLAASLNRDLPV